MLQSTVRFAQNSFEVKNSFWSLIPAAKQQVHWCAFTDEEITYGSYANSKLEAAPSCGSSEDGDSTTFGDTTEDEGTDDCASECGSVLVEEFDCNIEKLSVHIEGLCLLAFKDGEQVACFDMTNPKNTKSDGADRSSSAIGRFLMSETPQNRREIVAAVFCQSVLAKVWKHKCANHFVQLAIQVADVDQLETFGHFLWQNLDKILKQEQSIGSRYIERILERCEIVQIMQTPSSCPCLRCALCHIRDQAAVYAQHRHANFAVSALVKKQPSLFRSEVQARLTRAALDGSDKSKFFAYVRQAIDQ